LGDNDRRARAQQGEGFLDGEKDTLEIGVDRGVELLFVA
jgi:hypothetical protein